MDALYARKIYDQVIKIFTFNSCIISTIVLIPHSQYFHSCQRRPRQHGRCQYTWYHSEDQKASTQAKKGLKWNWCSENNSPCPYLICCCCHQCSFFAYGIHLPDPTIRFEIKDLKSWFCGSVPWSKIQNLQKAVTSEKVKHIVTKLRLVAKVNIEKKKKNC